MLSRRETTKTPLRLVVPPRDWSGVIGPVVLVLATAALLAFGVLGVARDSRPFDDFSYLYAAGQVWLSGQSAYNAAVFGPVIHHYITKGQVDSFFAYPPTFVPLAQALALLPYQVAAWVFALLNLVAAGALAWCAARLIADAHSPRPASHSPWVPWLIAALVVGNPFTATAIWSGQTTLIATALLVGGWYFATRERFVLGGILLGVACIKPQYAVLLLLWLMLERRWRVVLVAGLTALALAALPFITHSPMTAMGGWLHNVTLYQGGPTNTLGSGLVVGLPSLLVALGLPAVPLWAAFAAIIALTIALWLARRRICRDDVLGILLAIPVVLVFGHWYDLVLLVPLAAALCLHLWHRRWVWPIAAGFFLLLFFPNRPVKMLRAPLLLHWRSVLTLIALLGGVYLCFSDKLDLYDRDLPSDHRAVLATVLAQLDWPSRLGVLDRSGASSGRLSNAVYGRTGGTGGTGETGDSGESKWVEASSPMSKRQFISAPEAPVSEYAAPAADPMPAESAVTHKSPAMRVPPPPAPVAQVAVAVSVVLPTFNEAPIIQEVFSCVLSFARRHDAYEFIFVDDGSTDATSTLLRSRIKAAGLDRLRLIVMPRNQGKGAAMKRGFEKTRGQAILFTDGDLAYSLDHLPRVLDALSDHDVVIGSRQIARLTDNERSLARTILGEGFNAMVRLFMRLPYRDTQAGLKGFSRKAAEQLFPHVRVFRYSTDVELLFLARKRGMRIGQIPARVEPDHADKESSINLLGDPPRMLWDMLRIHFNNLRGRYD